VITTARAAWLGFGYGIGIFGAPCGILLALAATENRIEFIREYLQAAGICALLLIVTVFSITLLWSSARATLPKFVLQDGTLCPGCGYCLIGVTDKRCPECGRPFTYEELETTEAELFARSLDIAVD